MEILLNDDSQRVISFENKSFLDEVNIVTQEIQKEEIPLLYKKIHFKGCYFKNTFNLKENLEGLHYEKIEIIFENCYVAKESKIYDVNNEIVDITIINSVFLDFKIDNCKLQNITASRTIFLFRFIINEGLIESISMQNCLGSVIINDTGHTKCFVRFSNDNLYTDRNKIFDLYKKITIKKKIDSIFYLDTNLHFNNVKILHVGFESFNKSKKGFCINEIPQLNAPNKKQINYYPTNEDFKKLKIRIKVDQSKGLTEKVNIRKGFYSSIYMKGESESDINIEHIESDNFYLHDFSCKSLKIYELNNRNNPGSKLEIKNTNLPIGSFVKTLFANFESVNFYRNFIEKVTFSSCTFPSSILTIENIHYTDEKETDYFGLQYELYRQLKFSLSNSHNQIDALEMHLRMYNVAAKRNGLSFQDKFILFLNKISNNHSTSITRAFWLSISLIFILWLFYCMFLPNVPYKFGWYGLSNFKNGIASFFNFTINQVKILAIIANPVHSINNLSDVNKSELSTMNYFISFLSRVLVAWSYYQFVSAFRKFGKSL